MRQMNSSIRLPTIKVQKTAYPQSLLIGMTGKRLVCPKKRANDGWGFMSFGKEKPKWYQMKVCKTPEKCDIVGRHEVFWVSDEDDEDTHNKAPKPTQ